MAAVRLRPAPKPLLELRGDHLRVDWTKHVYRRHSSSGSRSIFRGTSHVRPCRSRPASRPSEHGRLAQFKHALYEAFFCEGEDIATDREIARAAKLAGLDPDGAVAAAYSAERFKRTGLIRRDAEAMGNRGVPSLLTDGGESHWGMGGLARLIAGEELVPRTS